MAMMSASSAILVGDAIMSELSAGGRWVDSDVGFEMFLAVQNGTERKEG
jgi:hypothetical protein